MAASGVLCTINTDDPAMFNTDLGREHEVAAQLGYSPREAFYAGLRGALCEANVRERLQSVYNGWWD
jgi:aminodeoxyfutalosine deaminase